MIGCLILPYFYTEAETHRRPEPAARQSASWRIPRAEGSTDRRGSAALARGATPLAAQAVVIQARGRVLAVSPEAEDAGLRPGMSRGRALAICPSAHFLPYDEDLYRAAQRQVLDLCTAHVLAIEPFSFHECFLDLSGLGEPSRVIAAIADAVKEQAGFTAQAGAGSSKLVAKIAALSRSEVGPLPSGRSRAVAGMLLRAGSASWRTGGLPPSGSVVPREGEAQFLAPLPVSHLWSLDQGVAPRASVALRAGPFMLLRAGSASRRTAGLPAKILQELETLGVHTIGLLQQASLTLLTERFGRLGRRLKDLAFGIDRSPVRPLYPPPVIEARVSLHGGVAEVPVIGSALRHLAGEVAAQLRNCGLRCGHLELTAETDEGGSISQKLMLKGPSAYEAEIFLAAERLLWRMRLMAPITALMLRAADLHLFAGTQLELLGAKQRSRERGERLMQALASARERFGAQTVKRAGEIEVPRRERMLAYFWN